jgi:uncharacterized protein YlxP (DUF503 family)
MAITVGLLRLDLFISDGVTLKDKRRVVKSLLDRLHDRFNVSASEVDAQDLKQRSVLAVVCVANEGPHVERVLDAALRLAESEPRVVVENCSVELL